MVKLGPPKKIKEPLVSRSVRFPESHLKDADKLGLDVSAICREAVESAINWEQSMVKKAKAAKRGKG